MSDNDFLHRFIIENTRVRGEIVHLNNTWQTVLERYNYPKNVQQVLGEAFAACALLSATIKYQGALILQIRADGPLHLLVVQATSDGTLRGLARWHGDVPEQGLENIFGTGHMAITIEPPSGEPYQGIVSLDGEHIQDAIDNYFKQSEQLNTRLWLAADKNTCSGFLLQELPAEKQNCSSNPENSQHNDWQHALALGDTLSKEELIKLPTKTLLHRLFHEDDIRLFEPAPLRFYCSCSSQRIEKMIIALGQREAENILAEQGKIQVDCEFCNASYAYKANEVKKLFNLKKSVEPIKNQ